MGGGAAGRIAGPRASVARPRFEARACSRNSAPSIGWRHGLDTRLRQDALGVESSARSRRIHAASRVTHFSRDSERRLWLLHPPNAFGGLSRHRARICNVWRAPPRSAGSDDSGLSQPAFPAMPRPCRSPRPHRHHRSGAARVTEAANGLERSLSGDETVEFRFGGKRIPIARSHLWKCRAPQMKGFHSILGKPPASVSVQVILLPPPSYFRRGSDDSQFIQKG